MSSTAIVTAIGKPIVSYIVSKGLDKIFDSIKDSVLSRCSEKRLAEFLTSFCDAISRAKKNECLDKVLDRYMDNEKSREIIFQAYRKVIFTNSSEIGPQIIGLITANALINGKQNFDELVGMAAEVFDDEDFQKMDIFFKTHENGLIKRNDGDYVLSISNKTDHSFSNEPNFNGLNDTWFNKLQQMNLIFIYTEQEIANMKVRAGGKVQNGDFSIIASTYLVLKEPVDILKKYYRDIINENHE